VFPLAGVSYPDEEKRVRETRVIQARRLTMILSVISLTETIENTRRHRVAGLTGARTALVTTRPFRAPPQTISDVGLIGGGHLPRPGEVSRAHHGMLFLDERPEFRRHVLEVLRQPLEESVLYRQSFGRPRPRRAGGDRRPARDASQLEGTTIVPTKNVLAYGCPMLKNSC